MNESFHLYPNDLTVRLEFDFILEQLSGFCRGELGRKFISKFVLYTDSEQLRTHLEQVKEIKEILRNKSHFLEAGNQDITELINLLEVENAALSIHQVLSLAKLLTSAEEIFAFIAAKGNSEKYPALGSMYAVYEYQPALLKDILLVIDIVKETVNESASPALSIIRNQMINRQRELQSAFRQVLSKYRKSGWLAEQEESVRNGRRVLALHAEYKRKVPGILLDESGSGNVVFIEPAEVSVISNDLVDLLLEERREIERILRELAARIRPYAGLLREYMELVGRTDLLIAKAVFADKFDCIVPVINEKKSLIILGARNPVLVWWHKKNKKKVIPIDLELHTDARILVISGPNAGGKSVALKTVGLLQLMLQYGMMIPVAEGSSFCLFNKIMADVGDQQSIENDMSTYSSHLMNMQHFISHADGRSLVLVDEMGAGTDPALGGPIAVAILETLLDKGVYGIITTHYTDLKHYAMNTTGIQNASMAFDNKTLTPLYQIFTGRPGSSYSFEIAQKSGLSPKVIALAKKRAGEKQQLMDQSLSDIQHEKQFLKGLRRNIQEKEGRLDELKVHYERLKKELEKEKKKLLKQYELRQLDVFNQASRDLERMMREWKEDKSDKDKFKEIRHEIDSNRERKEQVIAALENEPVVLVGEGSVEIGSIVRLDDGTETGIVIEIRNKEAVVQFGGVTTIVKVHKLQAISDINEKPAINHASPNINHLVEKSQFDYNIDLRGMYADEAIQALEQFMDKAILFSMGKVRIIHGIGTGKLKQSVRQYLKGHRHISKYYSETQAQGGEGVTVIELM